jgi:hypothetical protein
VSDRKAKKVKITWQFSLQSARTKLNSHYVKVHSGNAKFKGSYFTVYLSGSNIIFQKK